MATTTSTQTTPTTIKRMKLAPRLLPRDLVALFEGGKWFEVDGGAEYVYLCSEGSLSRWAKNACGSYSFTTLTDDEETHYQSLIFSALGPIVQCVSGKHRFKVSKKSEVGQLASVAEGVLIISEDQCPHCTEALRQRAFNRYHDARRFGHGDDRRMVGLAVGL